MQPTTKLNTHVRSASPAPFWILIKIYSYLVYYTLLVALISSLALAPIAESFALLDTVAGRFVFGAYLWLLGLSTIKTSAWRAQADLEKISSYDSSADQRADLAKSGRIGYTTMGLAFVIFGTAFLILGAGKALGTLPALDLDQLRVGRPQLLALLMSPPLAGAAIRAFGHFPTIRTPVRKRFENMRSGAIVIPLFFLLSYWIAGQAGGALLLVLLWMAAYSHTLAPHVKRKVMQATAALGGDSIVEATAAAIEFMTFVGAGYLGWSTGFDGIVSWINVFSTAWFNISLDNVFRLTLSMSVLGAAVGFFGE